MVDHREVSFNEGLYESRCIKCGDILSWELSPDPDSPRYSEWCCGYYYSLYPSKVVFSAEYEGVEYEGGSGAL